ncbi:MAG: arginine--tRNA ligase [Firmicutes bacterium]|nr:arginine--tRNA ligase [Bacillota bacterium]
MDFKQELSKLIKISGLSQEQVYAMLGFPPDPKMGDYCLPCFTLSKSMGKNPNEIAAEICKQVSGKGGIAKAEPLGGYANFTLDRSKFITPIMTELSSGRHLTELKSIGLGKTVCLDFSGVNIAKQPHVGHLSTTSIGAAISRIHQLFGYKMIKINYLGDFGTQFGKLVVAFQKWGNKEEVEARGVAALQELYIKVNAACETDEVLLEECRAAVAKITEREPEAYGLFEWFKEITLKEVKGIYAPLNISFDDWRGEFHYSQHAPQIYSELEQKGISKLSDGATIVDLEPYGLGVAIVRKSNGSPLYLTNDLAAAIDRAKDYGFEKLIYLTGSEQKLHFKQVFKILELMGYKWSKDLVHITNGLYTLTTGKISSRKGTTATVKNLFAEALEYAKTVLAERDGESSDALARQIGIGALVFSALKRERAKDVVFDLGAALAFEGDTSVYLQYTHARCCTVLEKGENSPLLREGVDDRAAEARADGVAAEGAKAWLASNESWELLKLLNRETEIYRLALDTYEPSEISRYLLNLAAAFNAFYANERIITDNANETNAKLQLVALVKSALATGLGLLGLSAPDRM